MKNKWLLLFLLILSLVLVAIQWRDEIAGFVSPSPTPTLTSTSTPTKIYAVTITPSTTPTPTKSPMPTSATYITLGRPFAENCGDGIPRIWSNDSFNGLFKEDGFDDHHGHVDIRPPLGCDVVNNGGEVFSPAPGFLQSHAVPDGYHLFLPDDEYLTGIENVLKFSGIENPDITKISKITIHIGHLVAIEDKVYVDKGQLIGEIRFLDPPKTDSMAIGYQVTFYYGNDYYMFSPTLFDQEGPQWECVVNSFYDCEPEAHDYAP